MRRLVSWVRARPIVSGVIGIVILWIAASFVIAGTAGTGAGRSSLISPLSAPGMGAGIAVDADMAPVEDKAFAAAGRVASSPVPPFPISAGESAAEVEQRIIKTGSMRALVSSVTEAASALSAYATSVGGFIEQSTISEGRAGFRSGSITLRVPVERFEDAMAYVRDITLRIREESSQGQDVTEQYTDLEARLRNARAQEQAYVEILDRADTVEDILKVQAQLGNIRAQIESLQGRLQYLENRTSFSSLHVSLEEDADIEIPTDGFEPLTAVKDAVRALVMIFQGVIITLIWTGITGLGVLVPLVLIIWLVYRLVRRLLRK